MSWTQRLLFLAVVISPWTSYLALSAWLRLPVVVLLLTYTVSFPRLVQAFFLRPLAHFRDLEDLLLGAFMALVLISYGLGFGGPRSFNHTLGYCFTLTCYLLLFKWAARESGFTYLHMARACAWAAAIGCFIVLCDSVLANFLHFKLRSYFLTGGSRSYNMLYFSKGGMLAVGGTAEEPGSMAFFLNILTPIGLWHLHRGGRVFAVHLLGFAYLLSMLAVRSTAGIVIALCAAGIVGVLRWRFLGFLSLRLGMLLAPTLLVVYFKLRQILQHYSVAFLKELAEKIALSSQSHSASIRSGNWARAWENFLHSPWFGRGPGFGQEINSNGYTQFFLAVLADTGIFTFACICLFFIVVAVKLLQIPGDLKYFLILPYFGTLAHLNIVGDYWSPPIWFAIAIIQMAYPAPERSPAPLSSPILAPA
jgi:hypothetical protein